MESNDSPEIPDRGETSDIPGLPSGGRSVRLSANKITKKKKKLVLKVLKKRKKESVRTRDDLKMG